MTQRIILIRHALSAVDPDVDSRRWGLAEGALDDCVLLADALGARPSAIWASGERKATETATAIAARVGAEVRTDDRFGEVVRPYARGDYRKIAEGYLRDGEADDWEPRAEVVGRFAAAVDDADRVAGGLLVIVNHGLAMSMYVASVARVDVVAYWTSLTFPDAWSLDASTGALERVFTEGRPAPDQT